MKRLLLYSTFLFLIPYPLLLSAQQDSGFTDKAEAKNLKVNGQKDGKWVEYFNLDNGFDVETKNTKAPFYKLVVYKEGKPLEVGREYYKSGKLRSIIPYSKGGINGVWKEYSETGQLIRRDTIIDNYEKGMIWVYTKTGKLEAEFPYTNDRTNEGNIRYDPFCIHGMTNGVARFYYESGKLKREMAYSNGQLEATKNYDENGKAIK